MGKMCCAKAAEGHGCGCPTKKMNWESYDKPKYKTMMAYGDGMDMPLIISLDTSGSTMVKYKEGVFDFDTINAQYRKVAISAIDNLSPSEVVIFDHNMTVEQVFKGSADDAVQFIRDKDNLQPRNGTARMSEVLKKVSDLFGNKLILTDGQFSSNKAMMAETLHEKGDYRIIAENDDMWDENWTDSAKEMAEEYGVYTLRVQKKIMGGWETIDSLSGVIASDDGKNSLKDFALTDMEIPEGVNFDAEEPVVQEPDWIPDGDGRAVGQQDFAINLSPLHAESVDWKNLTEDERIQLLHDAGYPEVSGRKSKKGMMKMQKKGMNADMVGNPSPMFNEDITGQDGPSAEPTNAVFEAMRTLAPSSRDVESARRDLKNSGYGDVIYDRYMVNRDGSSNKFYYTAVTEKDGKYYPMGAYGRIGYLSRLFNIYGKKENPKASMSSFEQAYRQCRAKENAKIKRNYVDFTLQMAEEFRAYDDAISSRQEWMIKKLGGTSKKSMTRSDASDYIKQLQGKESGTWQAETLAEIEGPTAEATTGGLHSPTSFTIGWEDESGYSSASLPPNEIAWAEETKGAETKIFGIGLGTLVVGALGILGVKKLMNSKKSDTASGDDTKKAEKGCGCAKTVKKSVSVKQSEYSVNQINPVEVEGQNDIHNAESIKLATPYSGPQTAHRQNNRPNRNLW